MTSETETIIDLEQEYVLQTYVRPPFVLDHGKGCWVYDTEGNAYLDCAAGIAVDALGHADPELVATLTAAGRQAVAHVEPIPHRATGASRQAALRHQLRGSHLLRQFRRRSQRGRVQVRAQMGARSFRPEQIRVRGVQRRVSRPHLRRIGRHPREKYQAPFRPLMPGVRIAPFNDLEGTAQVMGDDVCAVIIEPVQGEGGIYPATPEFLEGLRELCDRHNALLIFDEIQCGMGRTGTLWAHQAYGVTPDILTAAKPLAGGLPMGAILMTQRVADVMHPGEHGSTFAAGPLVSAVAEVVVRRVSDPSFLADVKAKGEYLKERLEEINSPHIKAVRGRGLIVGVDLDVPIADVTSAGHARGLLLINAGTHTLRLVPPLIITREEIDVLVERLSAILQEL